MLDLNAMKMSVSRLKAISCRKAEMLWGQVNCLYPWDSKNVPGFWHYQGHQICVSWASFETLTACNVEF